MTNFTQFQTNMSELGSDHSTVDFNEVIIFISYPELDNGSFLLTEVTVKV